MTDAQCDIFRELAQSFEYEIISAVKVVLCFAGALRLTKQWRQHGVRFLVHDNTKVIFRFYYALNILTASLFMLLHLSELIRIRFDCWLLQFRYILFTRGVIISTLFASQNVFLILSFERLYSTLFPAHFETFSSKPFALLLGISTIIGSYFFTIFKFSNGFRLLNESEFVVVLQNMLTSINAEGYTSFISSVAIFNSVTMVVLFIDFHLNFIRKSAQTTSLSITYQRSENRRIIITLLPIEITQTITSLFTTVSLVAYSKLVKEPRPVDQQIFFEMVIITTYFPLILTFFIDRSVKKLTAKVTRADPIVDQIDLLRQSWESGFNLK